MLVDFDWFRVFSRNGGREIPPIVGGFIFTIICLKYHVGLSFSAYSIMLSVRLNNKVFKLHIK